MVSVLLVVAAMELGLERRGRLRVVERGGNQDADRVLLPAVAHVGGALEHDPMCGDAFGLELGDSLGLETPVDALDSG